MLPDALRARSGADGATRQAAPGDRAVPDGMLADRMDRAPARMVAPGGSPRVRARMPLVIL